MLKTVESEIIPRLILSRRGNAPPRHAYSREVSSESIEVVNFATLLVEQDAAEVSQYLRALRREGASVESLYMDLMSPAARRLGCLWEEDLCSMIDVTLAVGRLHQVVREFSPTFQHHAGFPDMRRRALFLPTPGEQHTFGLSLVMEFFRRAGWDLSGWPLLDDQDLLALVRNEWFVVVGFSVGARVNLSELAALIRDLRRVSSNPSLGVMVGGPVFHGNPELISQVGADATAVDARQAVLQAESMFALL